MRHILNLTALFVVGPSQAKALKATAEPVVKPAPPQIQSLILLLPARGMEVSYTIVYEGQPAFETAGRWALFVTELAAQEGQKPESDAIVSVRGEDDWRMTLVFERQPVGIFSGSRIARVRWVMGGGCQHQYQVQYTGRPTVADLDRTTALLERIVRYEHAVKDDERVLVTSEAVKDDPTQRTFRCEISGGAWDFAKGGVKALNASTEPPVRPW